MTARTRCRFCDAPLEHVFADLGMSPLANAYLTEAELSQMEPFFPLRAYVCGECFLVQLEEYESPEAIFSDYAYFSSYSDTWLEHARRYVEIVSSRFVLDRGSKVLEIASNDGYLLQYFVERGVPVLGIEPAANVAAAAAERRVPTIVRFFGRETALELRQSDAADLIVGNNVLAHVPDVNDFVAGLQVLLKPTGIITMEFPHLMRLVDDVQFDTIYHEHFSYFSLSTAVRVFAAHRLTIFDVEELPTHGGSIRIYARHDGDETKPVEASVHRMLQREQERGFGELALYLEFARRVQAEKRAILSFFLAEKEAGRAIVGYGAPAKGNTLLNFCGMRTDFLEYTVDRSPYKQGRYLPGTHIPILDPSAVERTQPDLVFILPWNIRDEVMEQMSHVRGWGGRFVARSPELRVFA